MTDYKSALEAIRSLNTVKIKTHQQFLQIYARIFVENFDSIISALELADRVQEYCRLPEPDAATSKAVNAILDELATATFERDMRK
jgi:Cu2+-containing amine oxidase